MVLPLLLFWALLLPAASDSEGGCVPREREDVDGPHVGSVVGGGGTGAEEQQVLDLQRALAASNPATTRAALHTALGRATLAANASAGAKALEHFVCPISFLGCLPFPLPFPFHHTPSRLVVLRRRSCWRPRTTPFLARWRQQPTGCCLLHPH